MLEVETGVVTPEVLETQQAVTPETVTTPQAETEAATEEPQAQAEEKKAFSQAELDALIQKEKAKAEARAERRALKSYAAKLEEISQRQQPQAQPEGKPTMAQFANVEDYVEAVADWKLKEREQQGQRQQAEKQISEIKTKATTVIEEAEKTPGFDREIFDSLPLSDAATLAILDSDVAAKLVVHLTENPQEAQRIYALNPARQAAEIGKLEAKLASVPKVSKAPAPINPVGGSKGTGSKDPLKEQVSDEDFDKWRRKYIKQR